jgi:type IV pilus assembly protein PilA
MIVIAIIGILATMAVPSYQDRVIRAQVSEAMGLIEFAKQSVAEYYLKNRRMPKDNAAAGLPPSGYIVGNFVSEVAVREGAIVVTFGNRSNKHLSGKTLAIRPAIVEGYARVPIAWVCGLAGVPDKMRVVGRNETSLPIPHLPIDCRAA